MAKVKSVSKSQKGAETTITIQIGKLAHGLRVGNSVCINGACLTVTKLSKDNASFDMIAETINRTNLGQVKPGDKVNVERSLRIGDRLEGHFVLGHVDGTGIIDDIIKTTWETRLWIKLDVELVKSMVTKGSITVDGISLTLVDVKEDRISISLIPHTLQKTTLGIRTRGDKVNIETDILGKYVASGIPKR
jgi:riboflavin synthase